MVLYPYLLAGFATAVAIIYLSVFGVRYGLDLMVYRDAVSSLKSGKNFYATTFTQIHLSFTYPPFALIMLSPLAWTQFALTQCLLWTASIAAAIGAVVLAIRDVSVQLTRRWWCLAIGWSCISVLALEPVRSSMDYGQLELILMFLVVADLLLVPQRYRGILIGIAAAVKLTPLVFIINLLAMRDLKSVSRTAASFCGCTALAWALWPVESRNYWFHVILRPGRIGTVAYAGNQSWYAIVNRPPFHGSVTAIVWILFSLATVVVGSFVAWRCVKANRVAAAIVATALIGLLVSPISWTHHWVWVILIPPMIFGRRRGNVTPPVEVLLLGIVILTCAAPYWWWQRGALADVLEAVLPLCAGTVLAVWAAAEWKGWRAGPRRHSGAPSSVVSSEPVVS
jgi:alpha-1,2-mannosyltransferase